MIISIFIYVIDLTFDYKQTMKNKFDYIFDEFRIETIEIMDDLMSKYIASFL